MPRNRGERREIRQPALRDAFGNERVVRAVEAEDDDTRGGGGAGEAREGEERGRGENYKTKWFLLFRHAAF